MASAPNGLDIVICGIDEIGCTLDANVTHAISILDPEIDDAAAMAQLGAAEVLKLRFHDCIEHLPLRAPPDAGHVAAIVQFGKRLRAHAAPRVLIHCHMGISRSTAAAIILLADHGHEPDAAVERVCAIRPIAWPNLRMIELGDRLLNLETRLIQAVRRHHARVLVKRPELRDAFIASGRRREVEGFEPA
jgi:predicted protein tyrosine phosphatase